MSGAKVSRGTVLVGKILGEAPESDVTALRELFAEMLTRRENVQLIGDLMAGADVRYDMGEPDPAAATGRFAPNLDLTAEDGRPRRLADLRRDARPCSLPLLRRRARRSGAAPGPIESSGWPRTATPPAPTLLIRPDGYVAWAGADPDGLRAALGR